MKPTVETFSRSLRDLLTVHMVGAIGSSDEDTPEPVDRIIHVAVCHNLGYAGSHEVLVTMVDGQQFLLTVSEIKRAEV